MGQKFHPERLFCENTKNFGNIHTTQALVNSHLWGYFQSLTSPVQLRGGCYRISLSQQIPILKRLYLVWEIPWQWRFVTNCQKKKYGFGCYGNGGHIGFGDINGKRCLTLFTNRFNSYLVYKQIRQRQNFWFEEFFISALVFVL